MRRSTAELTLPCINAQRVKAVIAISPLIASNIPSAITDKKSAKDVGTSDDEKSAPKPIDIPRTKPAIGSKSDTGPVSA